MTKEPNATPADGTGPTVTIDEYQQQSYRTAPRSYKELTHQQFELVHAVLGLCTEVGELADTVKKHVIYRQPLDTENLVEEEGDVDWYLALLASAISTTRSIALEHNIAKLRKRYPDGYNNQAAKDRADKQDASQASPLRES